MREEDIDWKIYHIITENKNPTLDDIIQATGYDSETISSSLSRLSSYLLISKSNNCWRACSLEEYMIQSQINHDPFSPICIEGGVIRAKNPDREQ